MMDKGVYFSLRYLFFCIILISLLGPRPTQATPQAARLTITQFGAEIQLANTDAWIALPEGAVTPIGAGDQVRTNRLGRAILRFQEGGLLILPNSSITLEHYAYNDAGLAEIRLTQRGRSVQHFPFPDQLARYTLHGLHGSLTQPAQRFALDAQINNDRDYFVVARGAAVVEQGAQRITLSEHQGLRLTPQPSETITLDHAPTINFARIEGFLEGCPGRINTNGQLLRVRAGPGDDFFYMGSIRHQTPVQIMGQAPGPGGPWYRIQYLSDFGWVRGDLVATTCTDLRDYSRQGIENAPGIVRWRADELPLLLPFYGLPDDDVWFYRR